MYQLDEISEINNFVNDMDVIEQKVNFEIIATENNFQLTKPVIYVEGKTDVLYLRKAFELIDNKVLDQIEIRCVGIETNKGSRNAGCTNLNKFLETNRNKCDLFKCKVMLLYDSDVNRKDEQYDNKLFISSLPRKENRKITIGIENMFPDELILEEFFEKKIEDKGYKRIETQIINKVKCCEAICKRNLMTDFQDFIEPLKKIKKDLFPEGI